MCPHNTHTPPTCVRTTQPKTKIIQKTVDKANKILYTKDMETQHNQPNININPISTPQSTTPTPNQLFGMVMSLWTTTHQPEQWAYIAQTLTNNSIKHNNTINHNTINHQSLLDQSQLEATINTNTNTINHNNHQSPITMVDVNQLIANMTPSTDTIDLTNPQEPELPSPIRRVTWFDGIPSMYGTGTPIWELLEWEPTPYFTLFKLYRDQNIRSLQTLSIETQIPTKIIYILKDIYQWQIRITYYDQYRERIERDLIRLNQQTTKNNHVKLAQKIQKGIKTYLSDEDIFLSMKPKEVLDWLKAATELERLSLGLEPNRPQPNINQQQEQEQTKNPNNNTSTNNNNNNNNNNNINHQQPNQQSPNQTQINIVTTSNQPTIDPATDSRTLQIIEILHQAGALRQPTTQPQSTQSIEIIDLEELN